MKHTDASFSQVLSNGWQVLGELELPVSSNADHTIHAWIMETLSPLQLHMSLLNKILQSAHEAAARAAQAGAVAKFEHIHLLIFAPVDHRSNGQTWGFFRIEKIEQAKQSEDPPDHTVEFYLYLEGR